MVLKLIYLLISKLIEVNSEGDSHKIRSSLSPIRRQQKTSPSKGRTSLFLVKVENPAALNNFKTYSEVFHRARHHV